MPLDVLIVSTLQFIGFLVLFAPLLVVIYIGITPHKKSKDSVGSSNE